MHVIVWTRICRQKQQPDCEIDDVTKRIAETTQISSLVNEGHTARSKTGLGSGLLSVLTGRVAQNEGQFSLAWASGRGCISTANTECTCEMQKHKKYIW